MFKLLKRIPWINLYRVAAFSLMFFLVETVAYRFLTALKVQQYWMAMPILLYLVSTVISKYIRRVYITPQFLKITSLVSLLIMFCYVSIVDINLWFDNHFEVAASIIVSIFFVSLIVSEYITLETVPEGEKEESGKLFNLYYINTSKVHEIVMLIDNKIMKTVEKEQISEELLKYNTSLTIGKVDKLSAETGYAREDSSKKRVYENFDVKTTKSIMLRKIYETIQPNQVDKKALTIGDLAIFESIELSQRNLDDTVMLLNILQDSNIKDQSNESLEINLNKMMDKMLDDFTIDYIFEDDQAGVDNNKYIIQLPFKSNENFENGYQHNDLQLGKLSLIGVYRGEIDFSERDNISSKFLELMSESYNQEIQKETNTGVGMKLSNSNSKAGDIQFEFHHTKLDDKLHLIDVIAIIQELNIDRKN